MEIKNKTATRSNEVVEALIKDIKELTAVGAKLKKREDIKSLKSKELFAAIRQVTTKWRDEFAQARHEQVELLARRSHNIKEAHVKRSNRIEAYAVRKRSVVPALKGKFVVAGRVMDRETGVGIPNVRVKAFDLDRRYDDILGDTRTDVLGYYRIEYGEKDFKDLFDKKPEVYIEVQDEDGKSLFTSTKSFVHKSGKVESIDARVDGSTLPSGLAQGLSLRQAIDKRLQRYAYRTQLLEGRLATRFPAYKQVIAKSKPTRKKKQKSSPKK